jgi:hypothetical protein
MEGRVAQGTGSEAANRGSRNDRVWHVWSWLAVMMFVAFAALALGVLAIPFVGFGSLILVFLAACAVMVLVMANYAHKNREALDAEATRPESSPPGR